MKRGGFRRATGDDRTGALFGPTVSDARGELLDAARTGSPGFCPCCDHWVQFYRRRFHKRLALDLLWLEFQRRKHGRAFLDVKNRRLFGRVLSTSTCDLGVLKHWNLAEAAINDDPKKRTSGLWRITSTGISLVEGRTMIREFVVLYLDTVQRFDGDQIDFAAAIGRPWFHYGELMRYTNAQWWEL